jgi:hypothetical protein
MCAAIPTIALVAWQPGAHAGQHNYAGVGYGIGAGVGFAVAIIGLDYADTAAGAWPLVTDSSFALLLPAIFRYVSSTNQRSPGACRQGRAASISSGVNRSTHR